MPEEIPASWREAIQKLVQEQPLSMKARRRVAEVTRASARRRAAAAKPPD